ncbi:MAG: flagellar protein FlaG [Leptolinea sp.]
MSENFVYSVGKWNGEPPLGSASFPEGHHAVVKPAAETASATAQGRSFPGNTRLIFQVNEKDKSVVVMIVDEVSSKVIRTIPGDAIVDIPSGGLLHKNA